MVDRLERLEQKIAFLDKMLFAALVLAAAFGVTGAFLYNSYSETKAAFETSQTEIAKLETRMRGLASQVESDVEQQMSAVNVVQAAAIQVIESDIASLRTRLNEADGLALEATRDIQKRLSDELTAQITSLPQSIRREAVIAILKDGVPSIKTQSISIVDPSGNRFGEFYYENEAARFFSSHQKTKSQNILTFDANGWPMIIARGQAGSQTFLSASDRNGFISVNNDLGNRVAFIAIDDSTSKGVIELYNREGLRIVNVTD